MKNFKKKFVKYGQMTLIEALSELTEREFQVLTLMYASIKASSPKEIAEKLGISKSRILRLEKDAFVRIEKLTGQPALFSLLIAFQKQYILTLKNALSSAAASRPNSLAGVE